MTLLIVGFCLGWAGAYIALDWLAEYDRKIDAEIRHSDGSPTGGSMES